MYIPKYYPLTANFIRFTLFLFFNMVFSFQNLWAADEKFIKLPDINFIYGQIKPKGSSEFIKYLGQFDNEMGCEEACDRDPSCKAYTWRSPIPPHGPYSKQCFSQNGKIQKVKEKNHFSGIRFYPMPPNSPLLRLSVIGNVFVQMGNMGVVGPGTSKVKEFSKNLAKNHKKIGEMVQSYLESRKWNREAPQINSEESSLISKLQYLNSSPGGGEKYDPAFREIIKTYIDRSKYELEQMRGLDPSQADLEELINQEISLINQNWEDLSSMESP